MRCHFWPEALVTGVTIRPCPCNVRSGTFVPLFHRLPAVLSSRNICRHLHFVNSELDEGELEVDEERQTKRRRTLVQGEESKRGVPFFQGLPEEGVRHREQSALHSGNAPSVSSRKMPAEYLCGRCGVVNCFPFQSERSPREGSKDSNFTGGAAQLVDGTLQHWLRRRAPSGLLVPAHCRWTSTGIPLHTSLSLPEVSLLP